MNVFASARLKSGYPSVGGLFATFCSMFHRRSPSESALAASLAGELRAQPDLQAWVLSLADLSPRERAISLIDTARAFRGEWRTLGVADALKRIAGKPTLFSAVARELHAS